MVCVASAVVIFVRIASAEVSSALFTAISLKGGAETRMNAEQLWDIPQKSSNLADFWGISHSCSAFMRVSAPPFKEIAVNKAELTSALAMRTKMTTADATHTIEALYDDRA